MSDTSLPKPFQELERFVSEWALPTEVERSHKRRSSPMDVITDFYNSILPRWGEIMSHLKGVPADGMSAEERRLMDLSRTFVEVSNAVERFGQPDIPDSMEASRLVTIEGTSGVVPNADLWKGGA